MLAIKKAKIVGIILDQKALAADISAAGIVALVLQFYGQKSENKYLYLV